MSPKNIAPAAVSIAERALNVFDIQTRETFTVNVKDTDTIESVKVKIQDVKSWSIESMTIRAGGRILKDEQVISEKPLVELTRDAPAPPAPEPGELPSAEWLNYHTLPQLVVMLTERGISGGRRTKAEAVKKLLAQWFPPSSAVVINLKVSNTKTVKLNVMAGDTIDIQDYLGSDNDDEAEDKDEADKDRTEDMVKEQVAPEAAAAAVVTPTNLVFEITINPVTGTPFTLLVEGRDTISKVKGMILDKTGVAKDRQRLTFAGNELQKGRLADHCVSEGSELRLTQ